MILVVDDSELLFGTLQPIIAGTGVNAARAKDIPAAKRRLLEQTPSLLLMFARIGDDQEAGIRFCKELQNHPSLSQIPVLLFAEELHDAVIRLATDAGAKGIAPWPISSESLHRRLTLFLPELAEVEQKPAATSAPKRTDSSSPKNPVTRGAANSQAKSTAIAGQATGAVPVQGKNPARVLTETEKKLQLAQQIFARVLYDLKTSDLLDLVDIEDVPGVLADFTRSSCNAYAGSQGGANAQGAGSKEKVAPFTIGQGKPAAIPPGKPLEAHTSSEASQSPASSEPLVTGIDLDKIFGRKK